MFLKIFYLFNTYLFITVNVYPQNKLISAKEIEKKLAKIGDSLYACCYETSNKEYNVFLSVLSEKDPVLFAKCKIDSTGWDKRPFVYQESPIYQYYHRHPGFDDFPVVNINYEGASEYCNWLTDLYNNDTKKKFKKVIFILPSKKEWTLAAQGGKANWQYPWGNNYFRNKKGEYLCNFKHFSEIFIISDSMGNPVINEPGASEHYLFGYYGNSGIYTAKVKTFWSNPFGIYNMSGNVAEMINEKSYAMGGSWNSYGGEVKTTSVKQYDKISPEVGFRVFMKIVEK